MRRANLFFNTDACKSKQTRNEKLTIFFLNATLMNAKT